MLPLIGAEAERSESRRRWRRLHLRADLPIQSHATQLSPVTTIALEQAATRLTELAARVEGGEPIVVTRNGTPVLDPVPHRQGRGLDIEAGEAFVRARGITRSRGFIADDFDDPRPEDFLIRPLSIS